MRWLVEMRDLSEDQRLLVDVLRALDVNIHRSNRRFWTNEL
jgi:hypothetical protein